MDELKTVRCNIANRDAFVDLYTTFGWFLVDESESKNPKKQCK